MQLRSAGPRLTPLQRVLVAIAALRTYERSSWKWDRARNAGHAAGHEGVTENGPAQNGWLLPGTARSAQITSLGTDDEV